MGNFLSREFAREIVVDKIDQYAAKVPAGLLTKIGSGVNIGGRRGCLQQALNEPSLAISALYLQGALFAETYEESPPTIEEVAETFIRRLNIAIPLAKNAEKTTLKNHRDRVQTALYALRREAPSDIAN